MLLLVGYSETPRRAREQLAYVRQFSPRRARSASDADEFKLDLLHRMLDGAKEVPGLCHVCTRPGRIPPSPLTSSRLPPSLPPPSGPTPSLPPPYPAQPRRCLLSGPKLDRCSLRVACAWAPRGMHVGSAWHARARERILRECCPSYSGAMRCDAMPCDAMPTVEASAHDVAHCAFTLHWRRMAATERLRSAVLLAGGRRAEADGSC